ncbi:hypothetical protein OROGR_019211 [Orobanche gracilis]
MKRSRARSDRCVGARDSFERKLGILKRMIPNCDLSSHIGVKRLLRETSDYVMDLEMRVKVMKMMVNALTGSHDDVDD